MWPWIVGYLVDDMRIVKEFPNSPTVSEGGREEGVIYREGGREERKGVIYREGGREERKGVIYREGGRE